MSLTNEERKAIIELKVNKAQETQNYQLIQLVLTLSFLQYFGTLITLIFKR